MKTQKASGPPCPECESIRTMTTGSGYSDETYRIRRRRCMDCGAPSFVTAEVVVPATWGELESEKRLRDTLAGRIRNGYQGMTNMARRRPRARLRIDVRVYRYQPRGATLLGVTSREESHE